MTRIPGPPLSRAELLETYERDRLGALLRWLDDYGDVIDLCEGNVVVNDADAVRYVLRNTGTLFLTDQNLLRQKVDGRASSFDMDRWITSRHAVIRSQTGPSIESALDPIAVAVNETAARWAGEGIPDNVMPDLQQMTSRAVAEYTLGDAGEVADLATQMLDDLFPIVASPFTLPRWARIRPRDRKVSRTLARLEKAVSMRLPTARTVYADGLRAAELPLEWQIQVTISTLLAGNGVPAAAIAWALVELARHEEIQQQIREGDEDTLSAFVKEVLRLWPPSWLLGRRVARTVELAGYDIPEGTLLYVSNFALHRNRRYWTSPHTLDLERWRSDSPPTAYVPFGFGPRYCIGAQFASAEIIAAVRALVGTVRLHQNGPTAFDRVDSKRTLYPVGLQLKAELL